MDTETSTIISSCILVPSVVIVVLLIYFHATDEGKFGGRRIMQDVIYAAANIVVAVLLMVQFPPSYTKTFIVSTMQLGYISIHMLRPFTYGDLITRSRHLRQCDTCPNAVSFIELGMFHNKTKSISTNTTAFIFQFR